MTKTLSAHPLRLVRCLFLLAAAGMAGCGTTLLTHEKLDPVTSVTIRYSEHRLVFFRRIPGRAALAHDYVDVAPIEVNRGGDYRYYLWLGIWTTDGEAAIRNEFETVVIVADSTELSLENPSWTADGIGVSAPVYPRTFAKAVDAYYPVSTDQLRLLATATDLRLRAGGVDKHSFDPWGQQASGQAALLDLVEGPTY